MRGRPPGVALSGLCRPKVLGGLIALAIAAVVYSQFNFYSSLVKDSAIYVYGGQRFTHGIPPYASIMDPKGPMPGILSGFGVAVARVLDRNDVLAVRVEFCALSILAVLGIYLLVLELWHSVVAAVLAAAVFASFKMFAFDALTGPDGHTPGIVFVIFAMWLTVRRRWYWAGLAASLAFFCWQPLFPYPVIVLACAAVWSHGRRRRTVGWNLAGAATPLVALFAYYAAEGYPGKFIEGTFVFPVAGVYRPPMSLGDRLRWIVNDIWASFGPGAVLLWVGLGLLIVMAVSTVVSARSEWRAAVAGPVVLLLLLSLIVQMAYVLYDYIGWTHAFPLLPYAAVGFGAATAALLDRLPATADVRRFASAALLIAATALTAASAVAYYQPSDSRDFSAQVASACSLESSVVPGTTLWVIDNPVPLVLLHRANPDNYPYVGSGLAAWRAAHTRGGFEAWMAQIKASASVVVLQYWRERVPRDRVVGWLRSHAYREGYIGQWRVFVTNAARARMASRSIALTQDWNLWPLTSSGRQIRFTGCTKVAAG